MNWKLPIGKAATLSKIARESIVSNAVLLARSDLTRNELRGAALAIRRLARIVAADAFLPVL
jgi:LysM repeat protein